MTGAADFLEGKILDNGWIVGKKLSKTPSGTGGNFSTGYFTSHPDGREGFLKAIDFSRAFGLPSHLWADALKELLDKYLFERDICIKCVDSGITRVVHAIDHGSYGGSDPMSHVDYLIFEKADCDVRAFLDQQSGFDLAFAMKTLHGISAALQQLHRAEIVHQDIKPSNVLIFTDKQQSKLADFGQAWAKGIPSPHERFPVPGDPGYAPLELFAGLPLTDEERRFGYDLYLLGSMVVFFITRVHMNGLIDKNLDPVFRANPTGTFAERLPYFQFAFAAALDEFAILTPSIVREDLKKIVSELCNPDYTRRGNPVGVGIMRYSLARYVSLFNLLRYRAETGTNLGK